MSDKRYGDARHVEKNGQSCARMAPQDGSHRHGLRCFKGPIEDRFTPAVEAACVTALKPPYRHAR